MYSQSFAVLITVLSMKYFLKRSPKCLLDTFFRIPSSPAEVEMGFSVWRGNPGEIRLENPAPEAAWIPRRLRRLRRLIRMIRAMLRRTMAMKPNMEPTIAPTSVLRFGACVGPPEPPEVLVGRVGAVEEAAPGVLGRIGTVEEAAPDVEGAAVVIVRLNFEAALGSISAAR